MVHEGNGSLGLLSSPAVSSSSSQSPTRQLMIKARKVLAEGQRTRCGNQVTQGSAGENLLSKERRKPERWLNQRYTGISCQKTYCWQFLGNIRIQNWQKGKNKDPNYWRDRKDKFYDKWGNKCSWWCKEQRKRRVKRPPEQGARVSFVGIGLHRHKAPSVALTLAVAILKSFTIYEQEILHFHFAMGPQIM